MILAEKYSGSHNVLFAKLSVLHCIHSEILLLQVVFFTSSFWTNAGDQNYLV